MIIYHYRTLVYLSKAFLAIVSLSLFAIVSIAETQSATKVSAEVAFLQGQQYLAQNNVPLAELSLTYIASHSPYAKLLAGNIANQRGDTDQTFLMLLPLQTNTSLIIPALASLHASLADAYQKQGNTTNALDQLIRKEMHLNSTKDIENNHQIIWQLLTQLTTQDLITLRGESLDTSTQGWIDLSLSAKRQDASVSIAAWQSSYPDHVATSFAKTLKSETGNTSPKALVLKMQGNVALILPFDDALYAAQANAFRLGLQAAFTKYNITNKIKSYASIVNTDGTADKENLNDLHAFAKDEDASYFIGPMADIGLSTDNEAQAISQFAMRNGMQNVLIIASDNVTSSKLVDSFAAVWQNQLGNQANVLKLVSNEIDLKDKLQVTPHDFVLLAISANELRTIRSELDISIPTIGFSTVHESDVVDGKVLNPSNQTILNAIRWTDIPFLFDGLLPEKNQQYAEYHAQTEPSMSNDLKRWFALGVDYLPLLIASESNEPVIIDGLTGQISLDSSGATSRKLPIAKLTYDGLTLE